MSGAGSPGDVDPVGAADVSQLVGQREGPCTSVFLPTHRGGPGTRQDPIRLRNLLDEATARLDAEGVDRRRSEDLLAPHRALLDDAGFWRHLADGLALYAAPGFHRRFRLPLALDEEVAVGPTFRVRPLLPLLSGAGHFFVLALSQNLVSLYEATRSSIAELPRGSIPATLGDALSHEDPERQLQFRSTGGGVAQFHGHGAGDEIDKAALERFFRAVDRGVMEAIGDVPGPVVLASVAYYAPIYRAVTRHPWVVEPSVEGNPEHLSPAELHAKAWPLAEPALSAGREEALRRLREAPTARVVADLDDVLAAAREGRVEALVVSPAASGGDLLDRAIADTLVNGGTAFTADDVDMAPGGSVALLRF